MWYPWQLNALENTHLACDVLFLVLSIVAYIYIYIYIHICLFIFIFIIENLNKMYAHEL